LGISSSDAAALLRFAARRSLMVIAGFFGVRPWDLSAIVAPFIRKQSLSPTIPEKKLKASRVYG
jgi:hypothetical protein